MLYNASMIERYMFGEEKPSFHDGAIVIVDWSFFGGMGIKSGKIVGKGMTHVIDTWLVEFEEDFGPTYPFKVCGIPHTAMVKSMPVDEFIKALEENDGVKRNIAELKAGLREYLTIPYADKV